MERKLYPVWGCTGEYEDYSQWVVGLFPNVLSAQAVADDLNRITEVEGVSHKDKPSFAKREDDSPALIALRAAGDPSAHIDYTGIGYRVGRPVRQFTDFADFKMTGARKVD